MLITRRGFMKLGLGITISASPFTEGCNALIRTDKNVENIQWDANPAIPIPQNGCYTGWGIEMGQTYWVGGRDQILKRLKRYDSSYIENFLAYHQSKSNYLPAVFSFSHMHIEADWFPQLICEALNSIGVIPLVRFFPTYDFKELAEGRFDNELKNFAGGIVQYGNPLFLVPWPAINRVYIPKGTIHPTTQTDPKSAKVAWTHLHHVFENVGANKYAVWGLHILPTADQDSMDKFKLDPKLFDWLGFTMYTINNWIQEDFNFSVRDAYRWAIKNYPNKPLALFEIGRVNTEGQGRWIKNSYKTIKQLPRIKMAMYYEYEYAGISGSITLINKEDQPAYAEAIEDPYFIKRGSQIKAK